MSRAFAVTTDGLRLSVRLTPKGGRDAIDGSTTLSDGREVVKARVRAAPEDGAANEALARLLAATLGSTRSAVILASGHSARLKTFDIAGDGAELSARLASKLKDSA